MPTAAQSLTVHGRTLDLAEPVLMGIVNATPDSFSDAGLTRTVAERVALAGGTLKLEGNGFAYIIRGEGPVRSL